MFKIGRNGMAVITALTVGSIAVATGVMARHMPAETWGLALVIGAFASLVFGVAFSEWEVER